MKNKELFIKSGNSLHNKEINKDIINNFLKVFNEIIDFEYKYRDKE